MQNLEAECLSEQGRGSGAESTVAVDAVVEDSDVASEALTREMSLKAGRCRRCSLALTSLNSLTGLPFAYSSQSRPSLCEHVDAARL